MSIPKFVLMGSIVVFAIIGVTAIVKKVSNRPTPQVAIKEHQPVAKQKEIKEKAPPPSITTPIVHQPTPPSPQTVALPPPVEKEIIPENKKQDKVRDDFPVMDRIHQLFTTGPNKLPIVETITYSSSVPWLKGRPAWVSDYAAHYATSRHFIARGLNGKPDYFSQKISTGSRFNVFRKDKNIHFYLLIDLSLCKMGFYYVDLDTNERVLLKTYSVGLGRLDPQSPSGSLTPTGKYSLGSKVAIYKPGTMGYFQEQKAEMIRVFGTRWIPFDKEFEGAIIPAKGYGIHGAPWIEDSTTGQLIEDKACIGKHHGDGCIRLTSEDIEEVFSIVISKPTFVLIVKDFHEAQLPGVEVAIPSR